MSSAISKRNQGIDLFRIISMMMVVILHVLGHGGILKSAEGVLWNYEFAWLLESACYGAVNCFALISGYVGLNSTHKYSNIIQLWLQVLFISVVLQIVQFTMEPSTFGLYTLISSLFPLVRRQYWYFTDYTLLFFFMPIFNSAIHTINKSTIRNILIIINLLLCVPLFFPGPYFANDPFNIAGGYSVIWLANLYLIGAYIAKHNPCERVKSRWMLIIFILCTILAGLSKYVLDYLPSKYAQFFPLNGFISYTSPLILMGSIALFFLFMRITTIPKLLSKIITFASPLCFGVYIIHLHPLIWTWLENRFAIFASYHTFAMICAVLAVSIGIFAVSMFIEWMRSSLFKVCKIKQLLVLLENNLSKFS